MKMKTNNEMKNSKFKIMKAVNPKPENPCDPNLLKFIRFEMLCLQYVGLQKNLHQFTTTSWNLELLE